MGAGASLPETIDEPTARALAGERFDDAAFQTLAIDGKVTRAAFLAAAGVADAAEAQPLPLPPLETCVPSHEQDIESKHKPKGNAPWRSTAMFRMTTDEDLDVQSFAHSVGHASLAACEAFVAEGVLGPKNTLWQIRGVTLAPSAPHPSGQQKIALAMHGHGENCCSSAGRISSAPLAPAASVSPPTHRALVAPLGQPLPRPTFGGMTTPSS